uniref:Carboxynorspermidine/carboxyspermidine decarboxylase n=1 Tax=Candidatus Kentrum sp. TUN TaxID=2126343 RepID=A0A450ZDZ4_9GAMM|nr:MAG: carboxynorspermidine decarboxylase [Candidatus Kentron sp. TUN]VFK51977.1 MAG: carboxynorspermidine decarboxylase [Candidatus Kentron sp. TUN]
MDTPFYLIDENRMIKYLERIGYVREMSGAKSVLALKCFSNWCVFGLMSKYMDGTTSSGLYEARLGYEKFGGETHGYCVAYSREEVEEIIKYCDKIIFNSVNQFNLYKDMIGSIPVGLRINPMVGWSCYPVSNPVGRYSRLGVLPSNLPKDIGTKLDGVMFHYNCDHEDFNRFSNHLKMIENKFSELLNQVEWVSLGGGTAFTKDGYPLDDFCEVLKKFSEKFRVQIYLEPGEAAVTHSTSLVVTVLDVVHNERTTLIVDSGTEPHLLDVLTYGYAPSLEEGEIQAWSDSEEFEEPENGHVYLVCGRTCLAGDRFGIYKFDHEVKIGDRLHFNNVGGYSMVKKNWFNGIKMPSIVHKKLDGTVKVVQIPTYESYMFGKQNL